MKLSYENIKKQWIIISVIILFLGSILGMACTDSKKPDDVAYYTCPMHPNVKKDKPGNCPICGMKLVPVKKQSNDHQHNHDQSHDPGDQSQSGIFIDPIYTQKIGVQTEEILVRTLIKTVVAYGKVAHDPKLWVTQNELLEALKLGDASLIASAELKLKFLGLSDEWIALLKKERQSNPGFHIPTSGQPSYFEAFIYQGDVDVVKKGLEVDIYDDSGRFLAKGEVMALGTMVDPETRSVRVLIKTPALHQLRSNTFVYAHIKIPFGEKLSVPKKAVLFNGDHNMVYKVNQDRYLGKKIELGAEADDYYEVISGVQEKDVVVTNGHFLIDSETQRMLGGSEGGHQH